MLQVSNLEIEGKCLVALIRESNASSFFCNGFNLMCALENVTLNQTCSLEELAFETWQNGDEMNNYKTFTLQDFTSKSYQDVLKQFNLINGDIYINKLYMSCETCSVNIYDNREFTFSTVTDANTLEENVLFLIYKCLFLEMATSKKILDVLLGNINQYVLINTHGEVIGIYKDFDEYLSVHEH